MAIQRVESSRVGDDHIVAVTGGGAPYQRDDAIVGGNDG